MKRLLPKLSPELAQEAWERGDRFFVARIYLGLGTSGRREMVQADDHFANEQMTTIANIGWQLHTWAVDGEIGLPLYVRPQSNA
ncbi:MULTISPECIES: hypothetical protein [unclassified Microbacterium]|uniref:hypothetical protein n=1 Tax=unclassified Microbacterium TaxID=2609290 RepID=UPI003017EF19